MAGEGRLFLGARRRRAQRMLRQRLGWITGGLAVALVVSLFSLIQVTRRVTPPSGPGLTALPPVQVEVGDFGFRPPVVIAQPGTSVRWVFREGEHSVTESRGLWDSGLRRQGAFLYTLESTGERAAFYDYRCDRHGESGSIHLLPPPPPSGI